VYFFDGWQSLEFVKPIKMAGSVGHPVFFLTCVLAYLLAEYSEE